VYLITASEFAGSGLLDGSGSVAGIGWLHQTAPGLIGAAPLKVDLQQHGARQRPERRAKQCLGAHHAHRQ
jgi:hypothetical protein